MLEQPQPTQEEINQNYFREMVAIDMIQAPLPEREAMRELTRQEYERQVSQLEPTLIVSY